MADSEAQESANELSNKSSTVQQSTADGDELEWQTSIIRSFGQAVRFLLSVGSAVIGLSGFAYLFGFVAARSYLMEFNAAWLVSEMPVVSILSFGFVPAGVALFFSYCMLDDMAACRSGTVRLLRFCGGYCRLIGVALILLVPLARHLGWARVALALASVAWLIWIVVGIASLNTIVVHIRSRQFRWDLTDLRLAWICMFLGLWMVPSYYGQFAGMRDVDYSMSRLPFVCLKDHQSPHLRLLFAHSGRFYVAVLDKERSKVAVQLLAGEDIAEVVAHPSSQPTTNSSLSTSAPAAAETNPAEEGGHTGNRGNGRPSMEWTGVILCVCFWVFAGTAILVWLSALRSYRERVKPSKITADLRELDDGSRDTLHKYYFEFDRIQHMRITFWLAVNVGLLTLNATAFRLNDALFMGGAVLGLLLWGVWFLSSISLNRRLRWVDRALVGEEKGFSGCAVHQRWLKKGIWISSSNLLIWCLPFLILIAWIALVILRLSGLARAG